MITMPKKYCCSLPLLTLWVGLLYQVTCFPQEEEAVGRSHDVGNWCYHGKECNQDSPTSLWQLGSCAGGVRQSPINFDEKAIKTDDENAAIINFSSVKSQYNFVRFQLQNTGRTLVASNFVTHTGGTPHFTWPAQGDGVYTLATIHFHWGPKDHLGSEHRINKLSFSGEMHLIHYRSTEGPDGFSNLEEAIHSGKENALAVVGIILLASGGANESALEPLIGNVDMVPEIGDRATVNLCDQEPSPVLYLGNVILAVKKAYTYLGSLTTPDCSPVVAWLVGSVPIKVSTSDMQVFRRMVNMETGPLFRNVRKIQGDSADRSVTITNFK